jgi:hypothetical protein
MGTPHLRPSRKLGASWKVKLQRTNDFSPVRNDFSPVCYRPSRKLAASSKVTPEYSPYLTYPQLTLLEAFSFQ